MPRKVIYEPLHHDCRGVTNYSSRRPDVPLARKIKCITLQTHERIERLRPARRRHPLPQIDRPPHARSDLFHGRRRTLRPRRHRPKNWLPRYAAHPDHHAAALEPAHRANGQRTRHRHSRRGRLLYLGATWNGPLLGLSGNLAHARRKRFRNGAVSESFRGLCGALRSMACRRTSRPRNRLRDDCVVHRVDYFWRERPVGRRLDDSQRRAARAIRCTDRFRHVPCTRVAQQGAPVPA